MGMEMPKTRAKKETTIKITKELAEQIDRLIEERRIGYRSRQEFCNAAIRRLVEYYWSLLGKSESPQEEGP